MSKAATDIPRTQHAVQLIGSGKLRLNTAKEVHSPGPHQVLARVEAVSLCFSDLKLLKQFAQHPRKGPIVHGLPAEVLEGLPSYVPGEKPTVPGHECVCRIIAAGKGVEHHKVGERVLVQADFRQLRTAASNGAFGYNFEGGLQEYVLMDERVVMEPSTGHRYLIPVRDDLAASAVCLVEPWACVEASYLTPRRRTLAPAGRLLIVTDPLRRIEGIEAARAPEGPPGSVTTIEAAGPQVEALRRIADASLDDIVYFGCRKEIIEILNDKLAARGIINIVTGGREIGQPVSVGVGRVHYGMTGWIGTAGHDAADSYRTIPSSGEVRPNERICVVGAGGPMGQMHVIRDVCCGVAGISVVATDVDELRLQSLQAKASAAKAGGAELRIVNTKAAPLSEQFSYFALMVPAGELVAAAIRDSLPGCLINIFAGIPAPTRQELDLDAYIARRCFMFGTSGSGIDDMKIVLDKVQSGRLETNASVEAVCGMAGAIDGLAAVANRAMAGKIVVYPMLHELPLVPLSRLSSTLPAVAARLNNGSWCKAAEDELLRVAK